MSATTWNSTKLACAGPYQVDEDFGVAQGPSTTITRHYSGPDVSHRLLRHQPDGKVLVHLEQNRQVNKDTVREGTSHTSHTQKGRIAPFVHPFIAHSPMASLQTYWPKLNHYLLIWTIVCYVFSLGVCLFSCYVSSVSLSDFHIYCAAWI